MNLMAVSDAAERLGTTTRQVQLLVASGKLQRVVRGFVDAGSVERLLLVGGETRGRAWSESTAWAAISMLSGGDAEWLGQAQRSRLRARLANLSAQALVEKARNRATSSRYQAHPSVAAHLRKGLIIPLSDAKEFGLTETEKIDGYIAKDNAETVIRNYGLSRDEKGKVAVRVTSIDLEVVKEIAAKSSVLMALDLAESLDIRERRAGLKRLALALGQTVD